MNRLDCCERVLAAQIHKLGLSVPRGSTPAQHGGCQAGKSDIFNVGMMGRQVFARLQLISFGRNDRHGVRLSQGRPATYGVFELCNTLHANWRTKLVGS